MKKNALFFLSSMVFFVFYQAHGMLGFRNVQALKEPQKLFTKPAFKLGADTCTQRLQISYLVDENSSKKGNPTRKNELFKALHRNTQIKRFSSSSEFEHQGGYAMVNFASAALNLGVTSTYTLGQVASNIMHLSLPEHPLLVLGITATLLAQAGWNGFNIYEIMERYPSSSSQNKKLLSSGNIVAGVLWTAATVASAGSNLVEPTIVGMSTINAASSALNARGLAEMFKEKAESE